MIFESILTLFSALLLTLLQVMYIKKQTFKNARSSSFKILLGIALLICFLELAYVYCLRYFYNKILAYVLYKLYFICHFYILLFIYFYCYNVAKKKKYANLKEMFKDSKINIVVVVINIIFVVGYLCVPHDGMVFESLNFFHGSSKIFFVLSVVIYCSLILVHYIKNWKQINFYEKYSFIAVFCMYLGFGVVQFFFNRVSLLPWLYSLSLYFIYLTIENPDILVLEEINNAKDDIEKSNQTKTDFLSNMTYEIKSPMNLISSLCDELINMPVYDEKLFKEDISQIVSSGNSLLDIVNNILDISKIETGKAVLMEKEYKVVDLLTDVVNITKSKIGAKQVKLMINIDQNISSVLNGDYSKIYQALVNIMANSAKFTDVGRITFTLSSTKTGDYEKLLFKISDTGTGIKPEDQEKLFVKGTKLDNAVNSELDGSGYGLAITKEHVDTLGGKIWFESKFRVVTTFYLELPQKVVDATPVGSTLQQKAKPEGATEEKIDCSKFTVLIVDDNLLNIKVAKRVLEKYKFNVESVTAGKDCVYKIKEGIHYDAIFMDHMMPEMDGIETLHVLKKLDGYTLPPIIALTANAVAGMKEMYLAEGFDDYLSKPIQTTELDRVINKFFSN